MKNFDFRKLLTHYNPNILHSKDYDFKINFNFITSFIYYLMEKEVHEQYEYARKRLGKEKSYISFCTFSLGSLFLFVANQDFLDLEQTQPKIGVFGKHHNMVLPVYLTLYEGLHYRSFL